VGWPLDLFRESALKKRANMRGSVDQTESPPKQNHRGLWGLHIWILSLNIRLLFDLLFSREKDSSSDWNNNWKIVEQSMWFIYFTGNSFVKPHSCQIENKTSGVILREKGTKERSRKRRKEGEERKWDTTDVERKMKTEREKDWNEGRGNSPIKREVIAVFNHSWLKGNYMGSPGSERQKRWPSATTPAPSPHHQQHHQQHHYNKGQVNC